MKSREKKRLRERTQKTQREKTEKLIEQSNASGDQTGREERES